MLNSRPRRLEREEVDPNRNEDANVKGDPKPDARRHGGETFMHARHAATQIARLPHAAYSVTYATH